MELKPLHSFGTWKHASVSAGSVSKEPLPLEGPALERSSAERSVEREKRLLWFVLKRGGDKENYQSVGGNLYMGEKAVLSLEG
ncbi:hypothetical protein MLD38_016119 [Melastoma candidum]|uniref:Uncharacterized protein n=1 Tax=Melastoma candidum TaxID=119954 RepID=A0ACB9RHZ4_9MYRT|nr:hypothetical protein MLD38_016119 [Melastoma candidum]